MPPIIALVGRPNVGKSTLFNRLLKKTVALTHDQPGVTRDRILAPAHWWDREYLLVDTGGLTLETGEQAEKVVFQDEIFDQVQEAVNDANVVVFLVDGRDGLTALDQEVAAYLRPLGKNVLVAVNKVDGVEREDELCADFHGLGLPVMAVSAAHGFNVDALKERLVDMTADLPVDEARPDEETGLRIAVLGRPNAGKSSIINALVGKKRLIVSPVAGTTRDAVDVTFSQGKKRYTFVDTAGVRRRTHITDQVEKFSVLRSLSSSRKAQITLLVLDAESGVTRQDKRLLEFLDKEKTPFFVVVNKVDLVPRDKLKDMRLDFKEALRICPHVPLLYTSALDRTGLPGVLPLAEDMWEESNVRIPTARLNKAMAEVLDRHQPPLVKGRRAKFYYLTQADVTPQTFVFFVNDPERVKASYARYLEGGLRKLFGIHSAPISVVFRGSHTPRDEEARPGPPRGARTREAADRDRTGEKPKQAPGSKPDQESSPGQAGSAKDGKEGGDSKPARKKPGTGKGSGRPAGGKDRKDGGSSSRKGSGGHSGGGSSGRGRSGGHSGGGSSGGGRSGGHSGGSSGRSGKERRGAAGSGGGSGRSGSGRGNSGRGRSGRGSSGRGR